MGALGCTNAAAEAAISSLAAGSRHDFASNPGSSLVPCWGTVAPPYTFFTRPRAARASMSRRTVMSETPSSSASCTMRAPPDRSTSARIRSCRWAGSMVGVTSGGSIHVSHGRAGLAPRRAHGRADAGPLLGQPAKDLTTCDHYLASDHTDMSRYVGVQRPELLRTKPIFSVLA